MLKRKIILIVFILVFVQMFIPIQAEKKSSDEPLKILFIGSSYFNYNNLPGLFYYLATAAGKDVLVSRQITDGLYLYDHAQSSSTAVKIQTEDWDFVVLQGVGTVTAYPETYTNKPLYPSLINLINRIKNNSETTRVIFCMPWAFEDGMTWLPGWTDQYVDMQLKIYENTLKYSDELSFEIAPVGWAWNTVLNEKDFPLHYLHRSDWNHPSLEGSYLMNCVIFATVFKESPINAPSYGGLDAEDARYFQQVASNVVLYNLDLWNISTISSGISGESIPQNFELSQNFPNPFSSFTQINYSLEKDAYVKIEIIDLSGRYCMSLVNEQKGPGVYTVEFDGSSLNNDIYYYRLQIEDKVQTRKFFLIK